MSKIIGLRAGHSDNAPGASGVVDEHKTMKKFFPVVQAVLKLNGYTVIDCNSNADTEGGELSEGITKSNNANADLFISLHMNASDGSGHGTEALVKDQSSTAYPIAQKMIDNFAQLGFTKRSVICESLYEMRNSNCPNIIFEICFCDSQTDIDILNKYSWNQLAYALCNAIDSSIPATPDGSSISNTTDDNTSGSSETADETLNMYNLVTKDASGNIIDQAKTANNTISATTDLINTYGIRQEIITKKSDEDPVITAKRILDDNCKPTEEIQVECIGDFNYKLGYGVHVILPFLPLYDDCLMYIKEISNEWKDNGIFISTLTLTPSRVMDEQEWTDDTEKDASSSSSSSGGSATANKIIALLKQQIGKPYEWNKAGPDSFDCSGLMYYCYNQFSNELIDGKPIGRSTYDQIKDGIEVDKNNQDSWSVGDLVFPHDSHVLAYLGEGKFIHAPQTGENVKITDKYWSTTYAVRRVIPEDTTASNDDRSTTSGFGGIPDSYISSCASYVDGKISVFISNMAKYGYKDALISISKDKGVDPYVTAGIITVESEGNPNCGGSYPGLMQVTNGSTDATTNIGQGLDEYNEKKSAVGSDQVHVILSAYNSGQGTVLNACKQNGYDVSTVTIKQLGDALYDYVKVHNSNWNPDEKKYYSSRVLYATNVLKAKHALD